ncbi:DUF1800 domain-containing protein [Niabella terrae]
MRKASSRQPDYINVVPKDLADLYDAYGQRSRRADPEERRLLNRMQQAAVRDLNTRWFSEIVSSPAQLREKMAFFWHGHFASRNRNIFYNQLLLHVFRKHGLGNFGTLLKEVSHAASMLYFLNNQQNRKGRPNENFAREVMELFTLGRGHYSETDIKEAARAFTGWTANRNGEFIFREKFHDEGEKTVLGKKGNFNGDDVLDIILEQRQTALFITQKIYRFFVHTNPDEALIQSLAKRFYDSGYDINRLMEDIFTSDWFYDAKNIGGLIKSPIELLAGIHRMIPMEVQRENAMFNLQKILGQQLLYPPNVAGWPGGQAWIDSSTLMMRLRIPQMFNDKDELNVTPKQDDDLMMGRTREGSPAVPARPAKKRYGAIEASINWAPYLKQYDDIKREELLQAIRNNLLSVASPNIDALIKNYTDNSSRPGYIKSATIQLMSTPEYQLC